MAVFTTSAKDWAVGSVVAEADLDGQIKDFINGFGAWTSYTPTWSMAVTIGNGTSTGYYTQVGKLVLVRAVLTLGSTTAIGTNVAGATLPVTAAWPAYTPIGTSTYYDASVPANYGGWVRLQSTTVMSAGLYGTNGKHDNFSSTSPFTWTTSDAITMTGVYEAA